LISLKEREKKATSAPETMNVIRSKNRRMKTSMVIAAWGNAARKMGCIHDCNRMVSRSWFKR
jgi:hypothetical protein